MEELLQNREKAKQEGERLLSEAKSIAQKQARDMQLAARAQAELVSLRAKTDAEIAKKDALKKAQEEMKEAALFVAQHVLERNLTKQDQERFAQEAVGELEKMYEK
ncbi:MAG: hypothetical protein HYT50_02075 [Candidatus Wildermuthbacteria bacterium]|nr:hypothetical protein [Candidatus Wildermuthbacteria bacterium]